MKESEFYLITPWDPVKKAWLVNELCEGSPLKRVREVLGGRWTKSFGALEEDLAAAFWNASNGRKVLVLRLPRGLPREAAERVALARAA